VSLRNFPYRPNTNLYAPHSSVRQYVVDIANHWNLLPYIKLNHEVVEARWEGSPTAGHWALKIRDIVGNQTFSAVFDHLISAVGHEHYPSSPHIKGMDEWAGSGAGRQIIHSMYYRDPQDFKGRNVVVIGAGPSGKDISGFIADAANSVRTHASCSRVHVDDQSCTDISFV